MSHWKKFESDVLSNTRKDLLKNALSEMGIEMDTTIKSIRNSWGNEAVDAGFKKDGRIISLGLNFKADANGNEKVEVTGDFYSTGINEAGFIDRLSQVYSKHNIIDKVEGQGWNVDEVKVAANGEVEILAYQWS